MQTSDENRKKYQLGVCYLIQYQILQTTITRTVRQTVKKKLLRTWSERDV